MSNEQSKPNLEAPEAWIPEGLYGKFLEAALILGLTNDEMFSRVVQDGLLQMVRNLNAIRCLPDPAKEPIEG